MRVIPAHMDHDAPVAPSADRSAEPAAGPTAGLLVHGRLEGRGAVYDGERLLTEADYKLKDIEEIQRVGSAGREADGTAVGLRNIYGNLIAVQAGVLAGFVGRRLSLRLADGRLLPFTVAKVSGPHRHLIQGLEAVERAD